jgi:hypothetical protein
MGTQTTEGTGQQSHFFRSNPMQVTYRGVKYDTSNRPNQQKVEHHTVVETYRGIKHTEKVEVVS